MIPKRKIPIKVCGITDPVNMAGVAALAPDFMGFIFYTASPRDVTEKINNLPLDALPASIRKVAVMVNKPLDEAIELTIRFGFDMVQLHGNESPGYCRKIRKYAKVVKAFSVDRSLPVQMNKYSGSCDYFLFDTKGIQPGGNGVPFDHAILKEYRGTTPYFLSGGIDPEFTIAPGTYPGLFALDINSRFEISPGIKDTLLLEKFLQ
ncbi:MAG: phosphoribosylanthranilate isomerase [Bacteroidota bacterium]